MRIVVLQPGYLPWIGFFDQLVRADLFVFYDDVQYDKGGWRNRNRIKGPVGSGWGPMWLTVPVVTSGKMGQLVNEVEVDRKAPWAKKHAASLRQYYREAPFYKQYAPGLEEILAKGHEKLVDLDLESTAYLAKCFGIGTKAVLSSSLDIHDDDPTQRLLKICAHFKADRYLTGDSAENYLQEERFASAGVAVEYQRYQHPVYPQGPGEFVPFLSAVDLLFHCGAQSLDILSGKQKTV